MADKKWEKALAEFKVLEEALKQRLVEFLNWKNLQGKDYEHIAETIAESGEAENGYVGLLFLSTGEWHLFLRSTGFGMSSPVKDLIITYGEIFNPVFEDAIDDLAQKDFAQYLIFWNEPDTFQGKVGDIYRYHRESWITALMQGMSRVLEYLEDFENEELESS